MTARAPDQVDVIVGDADTRPSLVCVRALGRAGLRCLAIDHNALAPAFRSNQAAAHAVVPDYKRDPDAYIDALLELATRRRPRALILTHDGSVEAVRARRPEVEALVGVALAPEAALAAAIDKTTTLAAATDVGLEVPRGVEVDEAGDIEAAIDIAGLPLVVKPVRSWVQGDSAVGKRLVASVAVDRDEARAAIRTLVDAGGV